MDCELCGKELTEVHKTQVEGSILNVCGDCVKYGVEVQFSRKTPEVITTSDSETAEQWTGFKRKVKMPYTREIEAGEELTEDYSSIIRKERQKRDMNLKEFGQLLNEKESVISKLETGKIVPDDKLVKKLERVLKIKLREAPTPS